MCHMFCSWILPASCAWAACMGTLLWAQAVLAQGSVTRVCPHAEPLSLLPGLGCCGDRWHWDVPATVPSLFSCSLERGRGWFPCRKAELHGRNGSCHAGRLSHWGQGAASAHQQQESHPHPELWQELERQCHMTTCHHPLRHCHRSGTGCGSSQARPGGEAGVGRSLGPEGTL